MHDSVTRLVSPATAEERIREDMPASNMFPVLTSILGLWAVGIFLVSPRHDQVVRREIRMFGGALVGGSLILLALFFGTRPENWLKSQLGLSSEGLNWWPGSELQDPISALAFLVFALGGASAATLAVFSAKVLGCIRWFALFLAFCSGLLAFHGAMILAGIGLMVAGALFGLSSRLTKQERTTLSATAKTHSAADSDSGRDPALTALCGFLIATSLCGAVSYALVHESGAAGMKAGSSRLTLRFQTAAEIAAETNASDKAPSSDAVGGWSLLFGGYWIFSAAMFTLAVGTVTGCVLVRRQSHVATSDDRTARATAAAPVGELKSTGYGDRLP